jgi:hypothetical protein
MPGQAAQSPVQQRGSGSETWRTPQVKQVLSREEVAALLQSLSAGEPDRQITEPGPESARRGGKRRRAGRDGRAAGRKDRYESLR